MLTLCFLVILTFVLPTWRRHVTVTPSSVHTPCICHWRENLEASCKWYCLIRQLLYTCVSKRAADTPRQVTIRRAIQVDGGGAAAARSAGRRYVKRPFAVVSEVWKRQLSEVAEACAAREPSPRRAGAIWRRLRFYIRLKFRRARPW